MTTATDPTLVTDLVWNPRVVRPGGRGALVGTLLGVPVKGMDRGRGTAFQLGTVSGEVRTVWWDGTLHHGDPVLRDVDTDECATVGTAAVAWFARLDAV